MNRHAQMNEYDREAAERAHKIAAEIRAEMTGAEAVGDVPDQATQEQLRKGEDQLGAGRRVIDPKKLIAAFGPSFMQGSIHEHMSEDEHAILEAITDHLYREGGIDETGGAPAAQGEVLDEATQEQLREGDGQDPPLEYRARELPPRVNRALEERGLAAALGEVSAMRREQEFLGVMLGDGDQGVAPAIHGDEAAQHSILLEAQHKVHGQRGEEYGHPIHDFAKVVSMANGAGFRIVDTATGEARLLEPGDHAIYMQFVKIARELHMPKRDNRTDGGGYWETKDLVEREAERRAAAGLPPMTPPSAYRVEPSKGEGETHS